MASSPLGFIEGAAEMRAMRSVWLFDEDDWLLIALLKDPVYCAELLFEDPKNVTYSGCYHVMDYQYPLFRFSQSYQIYPCARSVGKTESAKARAVSHTFRRIGEDLLITAPELIHLEGLTDPIERRISEVRLTREFLKTDNQKTGFTHKPFICEFADGTRIIGRIPHQTGKGVKGAHVPDLIIDEGQDYPDKGYIEIQEVVMKDHMDSTGKYDFTYHAYGVYASGQGGKFQQLADSGLYKVTTITAPMRPGWNKAEKASAAAMYGGTNSPDYRRNVLGEPGQTLSQFFVTAHLMACFQGDTLVATNDGRRPIRDLRPGDEVLSAIGPRRVRAATATDHRRIAVVRLNTGEEIVCSPEHPFLTDHGWGHADRLVPGDSLYTYAETVRDVQQTTEHTPGTVLLPRVRWTVAGRSAEGPADAREARDHDTCVRDVWPEVRAVGRGPVLLQSVHGKGAWRGEALGTCGVSGLRDGLPAPDTSERTVRSEVPWPGERGPECDTQGHLDAALTTLGARRLTRAAVQALASPWRDGGRVVRTVLHRPTQPEPEGQSLSGGHSEPLGDARGGGRREWPSDQGAACEGCDAGSVASAPRVDSVAIYESGSDGWRRHCGDADTVTLFDLSVEGHPSFAVGRSDVVVHNCMDQDRDSHYNTVEFHHQELRSEEVAKMIGQGQDPSDLLDLPTNLGQEVYCGMDVGLVTDPTVIKIYTVAPDARRKMRMKLVRMIHLWRFTERQIRQCTYRIALTYGKTLRSFGQDIGGLGLPLYQAMDSDEECPQHLKDVSRGYVFNAKVPVAVDKNYVSERGGGLVDQYGHMVEEIRDKWTGKTQLVAKMSMIEASTRYLRRWVDDTYLLFPFHQDLIKDFQGETEQRVRAMAGARKKPGAFHMLDASRVMAMAFHAAQMEEQVYSPKHQPVMDRAVMIG